MKNIIRVLMISKCILYNNVKNKNLVFCICMLFNKYKYINNWFIYEVYFWFYIGKIIDIYRCGFF